MGFCPCPFGAREDEEEPKSTRRLDVDEHGLPLELAPMDEQPAGTALAQQDAAAAAAAAAQEWCLHHLGGELAAVQLLAEELRGRRRERFPGEGDASRCQ